MDGCELLLAPACQCLVSVDRAGIATRHVLSAGWPRTFEPTGVASVDKRLLYVTELLQGWDRAATRGSDQAPVSSVSALHEGQSEPL